ncbi:MAG: cupin domain-containing protein [Gammaproteobacteria bacterium]|nr:cupin domain-containing protein [Gammaproteobacteria bacterium]
MSGTIHRFAEPGEYYFREGCYITELLNGPDRPELSIARVRMEPGMTTRWHRLKGIAERYVILDGEGRVETGDSVPEKVVYGDVVDILPMTRQRIANTGDCDLVFLAICTPRFVPEGYEDLD